MIELLEAIFHGIVVFFRTIYRLLFNPFTDFLSDLWDLFMSRENNKKKDL
ncbi:hypothetical protein P4S95_05375 [Aneurinibacillus aneurinilyticus]|nr:hypothetical protein [Aneurinibacillus aneurinilyticus]